MAKLMNIRPGQGLLVPDIPTRFLTTGAFDVIHKVSPAALSTIVLPDHPGDFFPEGNLKPETVHLAGDDWVVDVTSGYTDAIPSFTEETVFKPLSPLGRGRVRGRMFSEFDATPHPNLLPSRGEGTWATPSKNVSFGINLFLHPTIPWKSIVDYLYGRFGHLFLPIIDGINWSWSPYVHRLIDDLRFRSNKQSIIPGDRIVDRTSIAQDNRPFQSWLGRLTETTAPLLSDLSPTTVLYPLSGYDLASVVSAFPDADTYILVSENEFHVGEVDTLPTSILYREVPVADYKTGWNKKPNYVDEVNRVHTRVQGMGGALPLLLGRMRSAYPGVEFLSVELIQGPGTTHHFIEPQKPFTPIHGIITFRVRPGDTPKTAIYINTPVNPVEGDVIHMNRTDREKEILDISGVDGIFVKGAQGMLRYRRDNYNFLTAPLSTNGGVLIEGMTERGYFELSSFMDNDNAAIESHVLGFPLSYSLAMMVTRFFQGESKE